MAFPARIACALALALCLAGLIVATASQASVFHVQDDAYMYARYAHNLLSGQGLAWDPGGEPTYGATALLYVPWVALLELAWPGQPGWTIVCASVTSTLIAAVLIARVVARGTAGRGWAGWLTVAVVGAVLANSHRAIAAHATNGMDTGFAMAWLAAVLLAWRAAGAGFEPGASGLDRKRLGVVLALGTLAFLARPDLGLFVLGIPLGLLVLAPGGRRAPALAVVAAGAVAIALCAGSIWAYFGVPLPLSFYVKSSAQGFGEPFLARQEPFAAQHCVKFLLNYAPLWFAVAWDAPRRWRERARFENALWLAVAVPTLAHLVYYRFFVLQVVSFHQRFYYPALPALVFLAASSLPFCLEAIAAQLRSISLRRVLAAALVVGCALVGLRSLRSAQGMLRSERENHRFAEFSVDDRYERSRHARGFWFALSEVSRLPDDLTIAATEVGLPSALNPNKRVIDLVGLNENGFATRGFDAERLCSKLRPDVLYLPHPDYTTMIAAIESDPIFQAEYEYFRGERLPADMGLALRRSSKHYPALSALVTARRAELLPTELERRE